MRKAAEDVQEMKEVLAKKEEQLAQAQQLSSDLLASITKSTAKAEKKKAEITAIKVLFIFYFYDIQQTIIYFVCRINLQSMLKL